MADLSRFQENFYSLRQKFFGTFSYLSGFFFIRLYFIVLLGINLLIWLAAYFINVSVSQDLVVLHYNIDFGVDLIGSVKRVYIIPLLGLIIVLVNAVLTFIFSRRQDFKFFSQLLLAASLVVNIFLLIALGSVYLVNFR
ncbi:MAG: hypothetical protein PHR36_05485 [Patescibacteria group bacterium]|nr:hypothetical protein [Patescibacteria group bacterium]